MAVEHLVDAEPEFGILLAGHAILIERTHAKAIVAGMQAGIGRLALTSGGMPFAVETIETVEKMQALRCGQAQGAVVGGHAQSGLVAADGVPVVEGGRMLLVEDDAGVAAIALEILEGFGLEVDWAETGDDALKFLQADDFDLMLTDVVMPGGMSGIDLAREAAARWPDLRIALTSGYVGEDVDAVLADTVWPLLAYGLLLPSLSLVGLAMLRRSWSEQPASERDG